MRYPLLLALCALYLLIGVALCVKGRLAVNIKWEVAITATYGGVPKWKVKAYHWGLRVGVVLAWPVFWFSS